MGGERLRKHENDGPKQQPDCLSSRRHCSHSTFQVFGGSEVRNDNTSKFHLPDSGFGDHGNPIHCLTQRNSVSRRWARSLLALGCRLHFILMATGEVLHSPQIDFRGLRRGRKREKGPSLRCVRTVLSRTRQVCCKCCRISGLQGFDIYDRGASCYSHSVVGKRTKLKSLRQTQSCSACSCCCSAL